MDHHSIFAVGWVFAGKHGAELVEGTVEELAEIQAVEMPAMYQDSRTKPGWTEKMASMYLRKQGRSLFRHTQPILWLEWSPERLEMLQTMYPHAQWLDTTSDKRLDARLAGNPSRKS